MSFWKKRDINLNGPGEWRLITIVKPFPDLWWPVEMLEEKEQIRLLRWLFDEHQVSLSKVRSTTDLHAEVVDGSLVIGALVCFRRGA
jgi:hypothetical protein